jgi:hypothetical protein
VVNALTDVVLLLEISELTGGEFRPLYSRILEQMIPYLLGYLLKYFASNCSPFLCYLQLELIKSGLKIRIDSFT